MSPLFAKWEDLPPHFDQLKTVLSRSDDLMFKVGDLFEPVGSFTRAEYDDVETDDELRAKAGLLNVYGKLISTEVPNPGSHGWFEHVQKILVISSERIVALVDRELATVVRRLYDNSSLLEYARSNADGHIANVPPGLRDSFHRHEIFSVKSNDKLGNVQLTIIPGVMNGVEAFLLDADVDENGRLLPHLYDVVVRHPRAGGSNPYYIFELLRLDYPQLDLGYRLRM